MNFRQAFRNIWRKILISILLFSLFSLPTFAFSGSGDGSLGSPFQITSCTQLQEINDNLSSYYSIANNIDCSDSTNWNSGNGFIPIGTLTTPFTGHLTGNSNYIISDLFIKQPNIADIGLFGYTSSAVISEVHLTNLTIILYDDYEVYSEAAGIVGYMVGGSIDHTSVAGSLSCDSGSYCGGLYYIGGFVGATEGTVSITDSSSDVNISLPDDRIGDLGGFIGSIDSGTTIADCISAGDITLGDEAYEVGGFVGFMYRDSSITRSSSSGFIQIAGEPTIGHLVFSIGGFVGFMGGTSLSVLPIITDSFSTIDISINPDSERIGGFVGDLGDGVISGSHSTGSITDDSVEGWSNVMGGFVGEMGGNYYAKISTSYATGNVTTSVDGSDLGGFVGDVFAGTGDIIIDQCWASGNVTGYDYIGGFAGYIGSGVDISNTFSRGSVNGISDSTDSTVGGYAAYFGTGATILNSYSTGAPTTMLSSIYLGSVIGKDQGDVGSITNFYWDTETSEISSGIIGTGYTTLQMKDSANFPSFNTYSIWESNSGVNDGYLSLPFTGIPNDNFYDRTELTTTSITAHNGGATTEIDEYLGEFSDSGATLWWNYHADSAFSLTVSLCESNFNTYLIVFMGDTLSGLSVVGENDDSDNCDSHQSDLTFDTVAGTDYRIQVGGYDSEEGNIALTLSGIPEPTLTPTPTPTPTPSFSPTPTPNSSSSSSSNDSSSSANSFFCGDPNPNSIPDLFQIDSKADSAKLFFTPISNTNDYYISYSTEPNAEKFGTGQVSLARENVQNYTINFLKPHTTYYFKVRGQNGCATGNWSNVMSITTNSNVFTSTKMFFKNFFSKPLPFISKTLSVTNTNAIQILPSPSPEPSISVPISSPIPPPAPILSKQKCFLWWCW